jgi:hypothetical protein
MLIHFVNLNLYQYLRNKLFSFVFAKACYIITQFVELIIDENNIIGL